jgi:hypothetical protein
MSKSRASVAVQDRRFNGLFRAKQSVDKTQQRSWRNHSRRFGIYTVIRVMMK